MARMKSWRTLKGHYDLFRVYGNGPFKAAWKALVLSFGFRVRIYP
jgi:hypothetical protein